MTRATLTTLGTGTIALASPRACAGHLFEADDVVLLLDCGSGVTRRLADHPAWPRITHVALTHFHIDHHGDLPTLIFAWMYGMLPARSAPVEIIGPAGTRELMSRLASAYGDWVTAPGFPLHVREISPGEATALGPRVSLSAFKVPHTPESVAYSITCGARRVVYTGDTGSDAAFATWAYGSDVLLCECSLPETMAIPEHMTPARCAELASAADPAHLVLTHFYPPVESVDIAAAVGARWSGALTLAHDGWQIALEDE